MLVYSKQGKKSWGLMVNTETLNTLKKQSKQTPLRLLAIIRTLSWLTKQLA